MFFNVISCVTSLCPLQQRLIEISDSGRTTTMTKLGINEIHKLPKGSNAQMSLKMTDINGLNLNISQMTSVMAPS